MITRIAMAFGLMAAAVAAVEPDPLEKLKLPGIKINAEAGYIDVESEVCLDEGALELVACTKDTKEHEAIIRVLAKPVHMHMALLLIGAQVGNPATQRQVGEGDQKRWLFLPAAGQPIHVSLVVPDKDGKPVDRPIADFIQRIEDESVFTGGEQQAKEDRKFPTSNFLFVGSVLMDNGEGPKRYLAEESGNVITISTFGDEMLGLSERFEHENGALVWEINSDVMPASGTKVLLRLKPVKKP